MIKTLAVILFTGTASIYNADLDSESAFFSILLPITSVISLIALALWIVAHFHKKGISQTTSHGGGSGLDFFDDGSGGGDGG